MKILKTKAGRNMKEKPQKKTGRDMKEKPQMMTNVSNTKIYV